MFRKKVRFLKIGEIYFNPTKIIFIKNDGLKLEIFFENGLKCECFYESKKEVERLIREIKHGF